MTQLRLGTRASALATTQSAWVARQLTPGGEGEADGYTLVHISTQGDRDRTSPLTQIGGTGVFVSAVREALLAGEVDVVVHSLKDLPTAPPEGIRLAAVPVREDPSDALITGAGIASLEDVPQGGIVGTGSPRRAEQLKLLRPDLALRPIRGNIDTRMAFAERGDVHAVILASAGLRRLGLGDRIAESFDPWTYLPAPAQGALAVEVRADLDEESELARALGGLDHAPTRVAVAAERELLRALEAGCSAPVAAYAVFEGSEDAAGGDEGLLRVKAGVYGRTGHLEREVEVRCECTEDAARRVGSELAEQLLAEGARDFLNE